MLVCAHGEVREYCTEHDMLIVDFHRGELEKYSGVPKVLVTNQYMTSNEYYLLKAQMLSSGYELVSTYHSDDRRMADLLMHMVSKRKEKYGGRYMFGMNADGITPEGRNVVKRILELRDAGFTLREIRNDEGVHHPNGNSLSVSTIQTIVKNRGVYEEKGL